MVQIHMDHRVAKRFDPSDVVQDTFVQAHRRLSQYLKHRRIPFYPWLRQLAYERLLQLNRQHLHAKCRTVNRELPLPDHSAMHLVERFIADGTTPSDGAERNEFRVRVRKCLESLGQRSREVLVLRFLEQLSIKETAAVLDTSVDVVSMRQLRALQKLRALLEHCG